MNIEYSPRYLFARKKFLRNSPQLLKKVIKTIRKFKKNPNHPSLNLEKLGVSKVWTLRIDKSNRIFFMWGNKLTAIFIDIGSHDKYRKY